MTDTERERAADFGVATGCEWPHKGIQELLELWKSRAFDQGLAHNPSATRKWNEVCIEGEIPGSEAPPTPFFPSRLHQPTRKHKRNRWQPR